MTKILSIPLNVVTSTDFVFMDPSTQALYFHLLINANTSGRVYAPVIARMIGANDDNIAELVERGFLNETGSCYTLTSRHTNKETVREAVA